jgi:site-specific recombinase XerD
VALPGKPAQASPWPSPNRAIVVTPSLAAAASPAKPQPKLLDRLREALGSRHYSRRTEDAYCHWVKRFIFFHGVRHPVEMGEAEVTRFLSSLAVDHHVSASTQNQPPSALLFLYLEVLQQPLPWLDGLLHAQRPARLPVVLSREEVQAILAPLRGTPLLMVALLYGAGLRLLEC